MTTIRAQLVELEKHWSAVARKLLAKRWASSQRDITHPQFYALHYVCERGSVSLTELGEAMDAPEHAASRIVDRLVRGGLVQRRLAPDDRRTILVEPTSAGREELAAIRRARFAELTTMLERLTPDEREALIEIFRKMADA